MTQDREINTQRKQMEQSPDHRGLGIIYVLHDFYNLLSIGQSI